jgi:hypothetical protein
VPQVDEQVVDTADAPDMGQNTDVAGGGGSNTASLSAMPINEFSPDSPDAPDTGQNAQGVVSGGNSSPSLAQPPVNEWNVDDPDTPDRGQQAAAGAAGSETAVVSPAYLLVGSITRWSGTPFTLVNPGGAVIAFQFVIDGGTAVILMTGNGNPGPYVVADGSLDAQGNPNTFTLVTLGAQSGVVAALARLAQKGAGRTRDGIAAFISGEVDWIYAYATAGMGAYTILQATFQILDEFDVPLAPPYGTIDYTTPVAIARYTQGQAQTVSATYRFAAQGLPAGDYGVEIVLQVLTSDGDTLSIICGCRLTIA